MRQNKKNGFSLIELMIVIVIISILAVVAIPAYQSYTIRAKVTEGMNLVNPAKAAVTEYLMTHAGSRPTSNTQAGIEDHIKGKYVSSVQIVDGGKITITYQHISSDADSHTLIFAPTYENGVVTWSCTEGTLPNTYRTANCRG